MATIDREFQNLLSKILAEGKEYNNIKRGVKRLQIPSYTLRHSFADGFPAITNKKLFWKGVVCELIWFLKGDNDIEYLTKNGITTWTKDAYNWYLNNPGDWETKSYEEFAKIGKGSVGQNYSVQWRNFNGQTDQIENLIAGMKKDIMSSQLKVNAWNPSELHLTALAPCHSEFQIIGIPLENKKFGFELHWNQRSVDTFLGLPFNIASYGLLAKILESITGYKALGIEGTLKCVHLYDNQYEAAKELLKRNPDTHSNCELSIFQAVTKYKNLDELFSTYRIEDFELVGYSSYEAIKVEMLAPKN